MENKGLVSIIVPVYNVQEYLREGIESILAQVYENWELILVDDGSKDNSLPICCEYVGQDSRIKVYTQLNAGPSAARNFGISKASGKYICFVDSDDTVTPTYLSDMLEYNDDLVICGVIHVWPNVIEKVARIKFDCANSSFEELITHIDEYYCIHGPVSKLFRSDIIKSNHITYPINLNYGEDLIFNLTYLRYIQTIALSQSCNYKYFHRKGSSLTNRVKPFSTMQKYVIETLNCRKRLLLAHHFTQGLYSDIIKRETSYYFWQALDLTISQLKGKERLQSIKQFFGEVDKKYIFSRTAKLPLRYRLIRSIYKLLPISIANMFTILLKR
jgi:glycosyltransferase involved in cell wall biosynthesis